MKCTLLCECNNKPGFRGDTGDAELKRIIDLDFPMKFTKRSEDVDEENNIFLANDHYDSDEFRETHKFAMIELLMKYYRKYIGNVYIPGSIQNKTIEYLTYTHGAFKWFVGNHEKLSDEEEKNSVPLYILQFQDW